MNRLLPALALLLLPGWNGGGDTNTDPKHHIRVARLLSGTTSTLPQALDHWQYAWENSSSLTPVERVQILTNIGALLPEVPWKKPKNPTRWNVLAVAAPKVNWKNGSDQARYTASRKSRNAVKAGFLKAIKRIEDASRGWLKIDATFLELKEVRQLSAIDNGFWLAPGDYMANRGKPWKPGEYTMVFTYLLGSGDPANTVPFDRKTQYEGNANGVPYLNCLYDPDYAVENAKSGAIELITLSWMARGALAAAGYPNEMFPTPDDGGRKGDNDYADKQGELADFSEHLLAVHVTPRMWQQANQKPLNPQTLFIATWRVSNRYNDGTLDKEEDFKETDPNLNILRWKLHKSRAPWIDLPRVVRGRGERATAYAATYIYSPKAMKMRFYGGCDDAMKVFVNGELILTRTDDTDMDRGVGRFDLKKGRNLLLLKVVKTSGQRWRYCARICDETGELPKFLVIRPERN